MIDFTRDWPLLRLITAVGDAAAAAADRHEPPGLRRARVHRQLDSRGRTSIGKVFRRLPRVAPEANGRTSSSDQNRTRGRTGGRVNARTSRLLLRFFFFFFSVFCFFRCSCTIEIIVRFYFRKKKQIVFGKHRV